MSFILVLGTRDDPHVERVVSRLTQDGRSEVVVADFKARSEFAIAVSDCGEVSFEVEGKRVPPHALVWSRTKILPGTDLYPEGDEYHAGFTAQEWRSLHNLFSRFFEGNVINSLYARRGMLKPFQQFVAARSGFRVPKTLVTNVKSKILALAEPSSSLIIKSLSGGKISTKGEGEYIPHNVMTMRVDRAVVADAHPNEFLSCPHFLQHEIEKNYELRVVVIGGFVQAFKINSQDFRSSSLDWRRGLGLISFEPIEIDPVVIAKVAVFMKTMEFVFGSIDLIVDKEGAIWFLECNEDGAWAWLDDVVDGRLAQAFADEILERAGRLAREAQCA